MDKVLIDTDVILDFFFDRQPFSEYALQIFSKCESNEMIGFVTPVIYSNVYYLLRQVAAHEKVIEKLNQLLIITDVLEMDKEVVRNALNSSFKDFEDSLQHYAALKHGNIDVILTRNLKDFKKSALGVLTPEMYIKSIKTKH